MKDSIICPRPGCDSTVYWHQDRCLKCGYDVGFPNIRELSCREEREALQHRYEIAFDDSKKRDAEDKLRAFEATLVSQSHAVINVWPTFLAVLLNDNRDLYTNYRSLVRAGVRRPASMKDDRARCGTEGTLFGFYADEVRYGALSLDRSGLISYGECTFELADITANARATVLEENSYTFIHRHTILPGNDIPLGYRAIWQDRHKLAIAKLANRISKGTPESSFPGLILFSDGNRGNDEFMEIHLYGSFDNQVVEALKIPKPEAANDDDRPNLERIRDWAQCNGKGYAEI